MSFVGGSVAASGVLVDAPLATGQSVRYAAAAALLVVVARSARHPVPMPGLRDWPWLLGTCVFGLVLFNLALVRGAEHAEPAVMAVAVACVPVVLALAAPLAGGIRPGRRLALAAGVVTVGAVLVQGVGRTDAIGIAWALLALGCEAGFTLFALPLLKHLGPWGVSVHSTWLAAVIFGVWALAVEGPMAVTRFEGRHLAALAYLAVAVTALAFILWYGCVRAVGAGRAGLLTGLAPVVAAATGVALGAGLPSPAVWAGTAVVALGLALGFSEVAR